METTMAKKKTDSDEDPKKKTKRELYADLVNDLSVDAEELEQFRNGTFPSWPSGSDVVDILTGIGGLPQGRIVECFGKPSSGKSTLLTACAGNIQKAGKKVIMLDFEGTFDPTWAMTLGLDAYDRTSFLLVDSEQLRTVEDGFNLIYRILETKDAKDIGIIIWDSIAGSSPSAIADTKQVGDSVRRAATAAILSAELPKLAQKLKSKRLPTTIGFVNQVRANMDPGYAETKTSGGFAFEHSASMRLSIKHFMYETKTLADEFTGVKTPEKIGQRLKITVEKTKHGQRGRAAEAIFTFQNGFDNVKSLVEFAIARKEFKKISALKSEVPADFTVEDKALEGTEAAIRGYYYNSPEAAAILKEKMTTAINKSYWEKVKSFSFKNMDEDVVLGEDDDTPNTLDLEGGDL